MEKPRKTAAELDKILRGMAQEAGPWPANMKLIVYPLGESWRIIVSYSDAAQTPYRDRLMQLAVHLRELYDLADDPASPWA